MSRLRCINLFQGELSHLQPGSAPVSYPEPEPAAVPACESLQEHGPGYDSEPGTHWWGEFTDYKHSMKAACIFALQQIEIYPCWCMASATMACTTKPHTHELYSQLHMHPGWKSFVPICMDVYVGGCSLCLHGWQSNRSLRCLKCSDVSSL